MQKYKIYNTKKDFAQIMCDGCRPVSKVCADSRCRNQGLMCGDHLCDCRKKHLRCEKPDDFNQLIESVWQKININQQFQNQIQQSFKIMFQKLLWTQELLKKGFTKQLDFYTYIGNSQRTFVDVVKNEHYQDCTGYLVSKVVQNCQINQPNFKQISKIKEEINYRIQKFEEEISEFKQKIIKSFYWKHEQILITSQILKYQQYQNNLDEFFQQQNQKIKSAILLYRGSRDGFTAQKFHQLCDGHSNTLILSKDINNMIQGGFSPSAWNSKGQYCSDPSKKTFIFNLSKGEKFTLTNAQQAIYCDKQLGPVFGKGPYHDLLFSNHCNSNHKSYSNIGSSYENQNYQFSKQQRFRIMTGNPYKGENKFKVQEIQVYKIYFKTQQ